jgi:hypothetical protein
MAEAARAGVLAATVVLLSGAGTAVLPSRAALPEAARSVHWIRLQSPNFICYTNGDQRTVARLVRDLERLREVVTAVIPEASQPVQSYIMVFREPASFAPYNLRGPGAAPVGYFAAAMGTGYLAFALSENLEARRVIYHEFLHSHLYSNSPGVPLWLNEGLAELYSTFESEGLSAEIGLPIESHIQVLRARPLFPLDELLAVGTADPQYTHAELLPTFYAESWALTHMLAIAGEDGVLESWLAGGGEPDIETLEPALEEYIGEGNWPHHTFRFTRNFEDLPVQAYAVGRPEILVRLGDLMARQPGLRTEDARQHYRTALGLNASYAPAVFGLGVTYELEGRQEIADSLYTVARKLAGEE